MRLPVSVFIILIGINGLQAQTAGDSVTVTFRFYGVPSTNTFVPGEFNNWGPNTNGVISPGAPSQMSYHGALLCWVKTYIFAKHAPGRVVSDSALLYKFNSNGCGSCWVPDPLNPELQAGDPNSNSVVRLTQFRWFEPYAYTSGANMTAFAAGLIHANSDSITKVMVSTGATPLDVLTTVDATSSFDRTIRVLKAVFPSPLPRTDYLRIVAYTSTGDSAVFSQGGYAVHQATVPAYAGHGVTPPSVSSGDSTTFRIRIAGLSYVLLRLAPSGQDVTSAIPILLRRDPNQKDYWTNHALPVGDYEYRYELDNGTLITDPWGRQVGGQGTKFSTGPAGRTADDYVWNSTSYQRPSLKDLIVYELNVGESAGGYVGKVNSWDQGNLQELTTLIPYFDSLGVNALELMPVMDYGNVGRSGHSWGYDLNSYFAIEPAYGNPRDLKVFVDSAHARGIAVILDVVYNHLNETSSLWQMQPDVTANPYFKAVGDWRTNEDQWIFFKDIDHWTTETQELVLAAQKMWIDEYRIDGFRYDYTQGIGWSTAEPTKGILGWVNRIEQDYAGAIYQIAEHLPESPALLSNSGMTSGWHDSFRDRVFDEARYRNVPLGDIENLVLDLGAFSGNDSPSFPSRYADRTGPVNATVTHDEQSLIYEMTQFHSVATNEAVVRDKLYSVLIFTSLGIPMLWQGQEFSEPRGWPEDGQKLGYRPVQWSWLQSTRGREHFQHYQALIRQRTHNPALRNGVLRKMGRYESAGRVLAWAMVDTVSGAEVMVVANFGATDLNVSNVTWTSSGMWHDIFTESPMWVDANVVPTLSIPAYSAKVFSNRSNGSLGIPTGVQTTDLESPSEFALDSNFPNPFNPSTEVTYRIAHRTEASLKVYSILGEEVATLMEGTVDAGNYRTSWNGTDALGRSLSSGTYLLRLVAGDRVHVHKMLLIR